MPRGLIRDYSRRTRAADRASFTTPLFETADGNVELDVLHWGDAVEVDQPEPGIPSPRQRVAKAGTTGFVQSEHVVILAYVDRRREGDAWRYTLDAVDHYFERVLTGTADGGAPVERPGSVLSVDVAEYPPVIGEMVGIYLESARLLGQRTAELHVALGSRDDDPAFAPEPFTGLYQRSLYQSLRSKAELSLTLLGKRVRSLPPDVRGIGEAVLNGRDAIMTRFRTVTQRQLTGMRIRCHGDYHLGQVLYTGRDFVILDFEGEPALSLGQRRLKRSPLVDVAGMLRSFDYAAESALLDGRVRPEDVETLKPWMDEWRYWVSRSFLDAYRETAAPTGLLPRNVEDVRLLLECYQLEKALYEVTYELNHRPSWSRIPLRGIRDLLQGRSGAT